jgi:ubiquinone/menaquinone biosynthesis C-methylase UbiE
VTLPRLRSDAASPHEGLQRSRSLALLDHARIQAWQRLLFVECGDGWIVEEAWRRARRGYACGVDTSTALVARATALRGVPGALDFKTWDGSRLPCPSGFFQGVIATLALERSADPAAVLGEMYRVLQSGGDVYLLERSEDSAASLIALLGGAGFHDAEVLSRYDVAVEGGEAPAALIMHARAARVAARAGPTLENGSIAPRR